jgi:hypothetical protein
VAALRLAVRCWDEDPQKRPEFEEVRAGCFHMLLPPAPETVVGIVMVSALVSGAVGITPSPRLPALSRPLPRQVRQELVALEHSIPLFSQVRALRVPVLVVPASSASGCQYQCQVSVVADGRGCRWLPTVAADGSALSSLHSPRGPPLRRRPPLSLLPARRWSSSRWRMAGTHWTA